MLTFQQVNFLASVIIFKSVHDIYQLNLTYEDLKIQLRTITDSKGDLCTTIQLVFSSKYFINAHFLGQEVGLMSPDNLCMIKCMGGWGQDKVLSISSNILSSQKQSCTTQCYKHIHGHSHFSSFCCPQSNAFVMLY